MQVAATSVSVTISCCDFRIVYEICVSFPDYGRLLLSLRLNMVDYGLT